MCQQSRDTSEAEGAKMVPTGLGCLQSVPEVCPFHEEAAGMERAKELGMLEAAREMRGIQTSR